MFVNTVMVLCVIEIGIITIFIFKSFPSRILFTRQAEFLCNIAVTLLVVHGFCLSVVLYSLCSIGEHSNSSVALSLEECVILLRAANRNVAFTVSLVLTYVSSFYFHLFFACELVEEKSRQIEFGHKYNYSSTWRDVSRDLLVITVLPTAWWVVTIIFVLSL